MQYRSSQISVLVVEMDPFYRRALAHLLREHCHVTSALKYSNIMELLQRHPFQTLFVDYDFPRPGVIALLEVACKVSPATKRVLMSGVPVPDLEALLVSQLVHAFVTRASTGVEILRAVLSPACGPFI